MKTLFNSICIILLIIGCGSSTIEEKDDDGNVIARYDMKDSLKHGVYIGYNSDGSTFEESIFVKGQQDGLRTLYYDNGAVQAKETYEKGLLNGNYEEYYPDGQLSFEGSYVNNSMEGVWLKYYKSGQLQEEVTFSKNEENGPFIEYHPNGNIAAQGQYINGDNEDGLLQIYDESGTLIKKMNCERGICRTIWRSEEDS